MVTCIEALLLNSVIKFKVQYELTIEMPNKNNTLPIGKLLQNAGLISDEQLAMALKMQSQYTKMKLGEILALQEVINARTADFFVDSWQEIEQEGPQFPFGYYLKQAGLLNDNQIETILSEQENTQLRFGEIAVKKGLLEKKTVDFFVNRLKLHPPRLMSLIELEEYDRKYLHLEKKYVACSLILSRILAWTGGNANLTKTICDVFNNSDFAIPAGMEINAVDRLIENSLIKNWQTSKLGIHIRSIAKSLTDNQRCEPTLLLEEYRQVLLSNKIESKGTKEEDELLTLGLIVKDDARLRVASLIFQQIFDRNWILQEIKKIESKTDSNCIQTVELVTEDVNYVNVERGSIVKTDIDINNDINNIQDIQEVDIEATKTETTEMLTKFGSLLTLAGITVLIPLVLIINNYSTKEKKISLDNTSQASKAKQFCNEINLIDPSSAIDLISKLEKNKELILRAFPDTLESFPDNCENVLNRLRVLAAPQLRKESRVIEALRNLCKIPADSENISEAKIWIEHWYTSPSWGKETKSYLNLVNDCPAREL